MDGIKSHNDNLNELKGAGSKRKLSSMFIDADDSKKTERPSSAKKLKFK